MVLATCVPTQRMALSLAGPLMTLLLISGGFFANIDLLPKWISWIQYISWFK